MNSKKYILSGNIETLKKLNELSKDLNKSKSELVREMVNFFHKKRYLIKTYIQIKDSESLMRPINPLYWGKEIFDVICGLKTIIEFLGGKNSEKKEE